MSAARGLILATAWIALALLGASGCASAEAAAGRDPMRCERNPDCARGRGAYIDCTKQCVDDPSCMDHCRELQADPGLGHNQ
jgi:hypothetical protein